MKTFRQSRKFVLCTMTEIDSFLLVQSRFVTHRKKLKEVDFVDKDKNGIYMRIMGVTDDIPEACS